MYNDNANICHGALAESSRACSILLIESGPSDRRDSALDARRDETRYWPLVWVAMTLLAWLLWLV